MRKSLDVLIERGNMGPGEHRDVLETFRRIAHDRGWLRRLHEAVATAEQGEDGRPSGSIVEVYQHGYRLGNSIIRPARVVVAA